MDMILDKCIFQISFINFSNICYWCILELPHRGHSNVHIPHMSIQLNVFHHRTGFSQTSQLLFMFQCNEHVEMYKFL